MTSRVALATKMNRCCYILIALLAIAGTAVLYAFAPDQHSFYPRCHFLAMTGWQCPGCGSLRATHSLLHGDLKAAFAFNPLLISLLVPVALAVLGASFCKITGRLPRLSIRPLCLWLLLGVGVLFAVMRNLSPAFLP